MVFGWGRTGKLHAEGQRNGKGVEEEQCGKGGNEGRKKGRRKEKNKILKMLQYYNFLKVLITENRI